MSSENMDIEDEDDFYAPEEPKTTTTTTEKTTTEKKPANNDLEEGEEEDEGAAMDEDSDSDDSDVDIITDRKDGSTPAPAAATPAAKYSDIRNIPQRSTTTGEASKPKEEKKTAAPSADQSSAAASKSTVDINADPIYPLPSGEGKPITQVTIDTDLPDNDKPWRRPGTDISDYFNYGFDEFTWALYAAKQESLRGEYGQDGGNKMMDMMMGGGGMPGMDGMPDMAAMQQMMAAQGMDPSQMDPSVMFGGQQPQQGFQGNFSQGGFGGYDQNMGGGGGGGRGGGGFRGRRGRW